MGGYVIESNINVPVQKFVSDSALFSLRWLNISKCQYPCRTALSVLFTPHHSTSAQNDVVGWVLSCCTRDVFNTDELPTQSQPKSSVIRRRTLHCTTGKDSPLCNTIVIVKATLGTISAYNIIVEVGEYLYHIPLYSGKLHTREHLPLYWEDCTLGRAPIVVLGKLYLGERLPLYWEICTWESTYVLLVYTVDLVVMAKRGLTRASDFSGPGFKSLPPFRNLGNFVYPTLPVSF